MREFRELAEKFSIKIDHLKETTSTNDIATDSKYSHGDIIIADTQTNGRGQRGNKWSSADAENLTFSLVLSPKFMTPDKQFYVSKIVSIAILDALKKNGIDALVKWPNDIYVGDRKIAGILIENDIMGSEIYRSIIGIGLNVNQTSFDSSLLNPCSMASIKSQTFDKVDVLENIITSLFAIYNKCSYSNIDKSFRSRLYRSQGVHTFRDPLRGEFKASIVEVLTSGELILRDTDALEKSYLFKEVEFIINTIPQN